MGNYKKYTIWLVGLLAAEVAIILATCLYLEPVLGDTTRLSGYSENDFGWNLPQITFEQPANPLKEKYDQYSDVLVLGDSFSFGGVLGMMNYPWQTYLTANTGLSVTTISHYNTKTNPPSYDASLIPSIVNSEEFIKNPPKLFILEVVERQLNILPKIDGDCKHHSKSDISLNITRLPKPTMIPEKLIHRSKVRPSLGQQINFAVKFWQTLLLINAGENQAYIFSLTKPELFSSRRNDTLLVYEGDVNKKQWSNKVIEDAKCKFINIQNMVQANGKTLFIVMIAPDKLTSYSPFLTDSSVINYSAIPKLASDPFLNLPRFDLPLQSAIKDGSVDVYLPNDTHWAGKGHQIVADALIKYLSKLPNN